MKKRTWDTERAQQLLDEGHDEATVAEMVGVTVAALRSWRYKQTPKAPAFSLAEEPQEVEPQEEAPKAEDTKPINFGVITVSSELRVRAGDRAQALKLLELATKAIREGID